MDGSLADASTHRDALDVGPEEACALLHDSSVSLAPIPCPSAPPTSHRPEKRDSHTRNNGPESSRPNKRPRATLSNSRPFAHLPLPLQLPGLACSPQPPLATAARPPALRDSTQRPRTESRKERRRAYKAKQRDSSFIEAGQLGRSKGARQHLEGDILVTAGLDTHTLPVNSSGYEARAPPKRARKKLDLQDLLAEGGWTKVEWDGTYVLHGLGAPPFG